MSNASGHLNRPPPPSHESLLRPNSRHQAPALPPLPSSCPSHGGHGKAPCAYPSHPPSLHSTLAEPSPPPGLCTSSAGFNPPKVCSSPPSVRPSHARPSCTPVITHEATQSSRTRPVLSPSRALLGLNSGQPGAFKAQTQRGRKPTHAVWGAARDGGGPWGPVRARAGRACPTDFNAPHSPHSRGRPSRPLEPA